MPDWITTIFGSASGEVSALQMSARATIIVVYGLAMIRLFGRRIFGRWTAIDVLLSVLIGSNLSRALTGNSPLLTTLIATTWLMILYWGVVKLAMHSDTVSRIVKGRASLLVEDGRVDWDEMRRHGLGKRDLREAMREQGVNDFDRVHIARLERDGNITIESN